MKEIPLTVRRSVELLGIVLLGYVLVIGQSIIMPVLTAFFISIMLLPVYNLFKRIRTPEAMAIFMPILLLAVAVALIGWFFSFQVSSLIADFPEIKKNVAKYLNSLSLWINEKTHFSTQQQAKLLDEQANKLLNSGGAMLSGAAGSVSSTLIFIGLLPIYIYLFLYYKNLLLRFVFLWFEESSHKKVREAMLEIKVIIKSYLLGLLIQITYITVLLGGILLLLGIKHALLIAVIFAFLNLIPYIGALFGNLIGVMLTLTSSEELWPIIAVLGTIAVVQFLDNNILMPRIVGSKVKINAMAAIIGVFAAGSLAGIPGMFLALPIIAVMKVTFDRSEQLKHWGVLLGDERPDKSPITTPKLRVQTEHIQETPEKENKIKSTKK